MAANTGCPGDESPGDLIDVGKSLIIAVGVDGAVQDGEVCEGCGAGESEECINMGAGVVDAAAGSVCGDVGAALLVM